MKVLLIFLIICSLISYANSKAPTFKSSKIFEGLKKIEKQRRTGKGKFELDFKTRDYLTRKSYFMGIELDLFQKYIFELRKDKKELDAIEELFELSNMSEVNILKRKNIEQMIGLLARLNENPQAKFKIKATQILLAVKNWRFEEVAELKKLLSEVAMETEADKSSPNSKLLEIINPVYHDQVRRKCF